MKTTQVLFSLIILISLVYISCEPIEKAGEIPEIHFKSFGPFYLFLYDTINNDYVLASDLVFGFIDGDADLEVLKDRRTQMCFIALSKDQW